MRKFIALLRGINVGGKNKISMSELKVAFEGYGFVGVQTYINSGNVIFSSDITNEAELRKICEHAITDKFKLSIPVAIISAEDLANTLQNAPDWWGVAPETKHNAIFVLHPATPESIIEQIGEVKPEYEKVGYYGQVIFWSAPIKTFSKVRWIQIVSKGDYSNVTIRNSNTAKKLLELIK